ncbi:MAG TPA: radical SAM protein [Deltaproteobacteria bacterium]|nr:radical SAM protein [Deltaproteobacteria bacterium]
MGRCRLCGKASPFISEVIGYCADCIRSRFSEVKEDLERLHRQGRRRDGLPPEVPSYAQGRTCRLCSHRCRIPPGERGFCGIYENRQGRLVPLSGDIRKAFVHYYYDPLPTNCCAAWVCPGCSSSGYPRYSHREGPEYGYLNLAVFYSACNFDCLFCQNWTYRGGIEGEPLDVSDLVRAVHEGVSCICFFGGDPAPQAPHAILTAREALEAAKGRILRICWETNGGESPAVIGQMAALSLNSGGCIKVDLKCWTEEMSLALSGVSNRASKENFRRLALYHRQRRDPPLLIASTLLVPGYVDLEEVRGIARFIAELDPSIPWTLLAFHPDFMLRDLPPTPRSHAMAALQVAKEEGLQEVHLGNVHLLW